MNFKQVRKNYPIDIEIFNSPFVNVERPHDSSILPSAEYLIILELQYPSDTKKSPFDVTATAVGLQNKDKSVPYTNRVPSVSKGVLFFVVAGYMGGNLNT